MKQLTLALLAATAATALPSLAHAGAPPQITWKSPLGLVAYPDGPGAYHRITLTGTDLALPTTTGYTLTTDTAVYAYWDGWHQLGDGWLQSVSWGGTTERTVSLPPLRHAGDLVLYICTVNGCGSATVPVRDPIAAVPRFRDPSYRHPVIDASVSSTDFRRMMRVRVDNLDNYEDTGFWGMSTSVGYMNAYEGVIDLWMRDTLPGHYSLWIRNRYGWGAVGVDIIDRPTLTTMTPAQVTSVPSAVTLTFRDAYSTPELWGARLDVPGCASQTVSLAATSATTFTFTMPATCRAWYASYDATLVVQNIAGTGSITIPVRPVTVTSPGGGGFGWPR